MVLNGLQSVLERLYDLRSGHDVYDYLVTDRGVLSQFSPDNDARELDEKLLLAESADGAGVALYLDGALLKRLELANPVGTLNDENLADYCTALEGVSHFVYSTWRLSADSPVSLLELEIQAEVDKYAVTVFLVALQQGGSYPKHVHARLFDRVRFDARLEHAQFERYRTAHTLAARFCRRLERRFVNRGVTRIEALVRELRKFYRLGNREKLRYALA
jgi:hypothetical protein